MPIILYSLPLAVIFLSAVMLVLLLMLSSLLKKYSDITKGREHFKVNLMKEEAEILQKAQLKAEEIISEALKNSSHIEKRTESFQSQTSGLLDKEINQIVSSYTDKLKETSGKILENYKNSLEKQVEENTKQLNEYSKTIEKENLKAMEEEIEKQKKEKLEKLNSDIFEITQTAAEEIIKKSLKLGDHEDLVMEALEKAKLVIGNWWNPNH